MHEAIAAFGGMPLNLFTEEPMVAE